MAADTISTQPTSTTAMTTSGDGSDDRNRDGSDGSSEVPAVVVVGCASGLVAWFSLLAMTTTTSGSNDTAAAAADGCGCDGGVVLISGKARVWREFDGAQVR